MSTAIVQVPSSLTGSGARTAVVAQAGLALVTQAAAYFAAPVLGLALPATALVLVGIGAVVKPHAGGFVVFSEVDDLGARQAELGRQPRRARRFFLEHADRILFGTNFEPSAAMYASFFRWLETDDESFAYHDSPKQGRWQIYGLGLPDAVLRKVYERNATRLLTGK